MPQPLVSVIVPAYNAAGCIARCVESIVSQSYQELEILLLNDGSTDDTLAVCRKLAAADSRIRVVDKPNTGAAAHLHPAAAARCTHPAAGQNIPCTGVPARCARPRPGCIPQCEIPSHILLSASRPP